MTTLKRIDPRRPFVVTAAGLKRITLGETGVAPGDAASWRPHAHGAAAASYNFV